MLFGRASGSVRCVRYETIRTASRRYYVLSSLYPSSIIIGKSSVARKVYKIEVNLNVRNQFLSFIVTSVSYGASIDALAITGSHWAQGRCIEESQHSGTCFLLSSKWTNRQTYAQRDEKTHGRMDIRTDIHTMKPK